MSPAASSQLTGFTAASTAVTGTSSLLAKLQLAGVSSGPAAAMGSMCQTIEAGELTMHKQIGSGAYGKVWGRRGTKKLE